MAVAGLVVLSRAEDLAAVRERMQAHPPLCCVEAVEADGGCKTAAVLEVPSDQMEDAMAGILTWEGVLAVDVAFLSYEDELEAGQEIRCPVHKARRCSAEHKA